MPKPSWLRLDFLLKARPNFFKEQVVSEFDLQTAKNELAEAEAALAQAKAQETNARNDLSYTEVKSPVDGVASMIPYRVGALVSSTISEPLVSVSDDQEVYAYFPCRRIKFSTCFNNMVLCKRRCRKCLT